MSWADIDSRILDPEWYTDLAYYDAFATLRREDPVHRASDPAFGKDYWFVSRYHDVQAVLNDWSSFSSRWDTRIPRRAARMSPEEVYDNGFATDMTRLDNPIHDLYRSPLNKYFSKPSIAKHAARVAQITDDILGEVAGLGECDLVEQVAAPLPMRVVLGLLGVPTEDWPALRDSTMRWLAPSTPKYTIDGDVAKTSRLGQQELLTYCENLALARRKDPQDDFATLIANLTIDGDPLSVYEMRTYFRGMIAAGLETTKNAAGGGLWLFMKNREQRDLLAADPSLVDGAVDEVLRWIAPGRSRFRVATRDVELRGKRIKAGDWVIASAAAANRDEEIFTRPDVFDIRRDEGQHMSLGYGVHLCLGRMLARLELRTLFVKLITRFPDMEITAESTWIPDPNSSGPVTVPVAYTPN